jgi:teichuronic acid biosynthesis glycosyltransferase TuaG
VYGMVLTDTLVSIITPAYKSASTIGETIQSVVDQTYANWEMLIVDDCSPDDTKEVVIEWTRRDSRVRLIAHSQNGGPAEARNTAIRASTGRWLAFLDSDDTWITGKLERTLAHARSHQSPLTFTGFRRMSFDGKIKGRYIGVPETITYRQLLRNTVIATSTVLIDRSLVGDVVMKKTYYDDFSCWLDILRPGRIGHGLDEDLMNYRILQNSVSRNKRNSAIKVWKAYREIERLSIPASVWNFAGYAWNGYRKYSQF